MCKALGWVAALFNRVIRAYNRQLTLPSGTGRELPRECPREAIGRTVLVVSKGWKPVVAPPFQRNAVNFNHCARFALCFFRSRYRLNRLPLLCSESGPPRSPQIPPRSESKHGLPPRCFQRCSWLLVIVIVPQSTGLGGRTGRRTIRAVSRGKRPSHIATGDHCAAPVKYMELVVVQQVPCPCRTKKRITANQGCGLWGAGQSSACSSSSSGSSSSTAAQQDHQSH